MDNNLSRTKKDKSVNHAILDAILTQNFFPLLENTGVNVYLNPEEDEEVCFQVGNNIYLRRRFCFNHLLNYENYAKEEMLDLCQKALRMDEAVQKCKITPQPYTTVDMGTGVLWANMNVGAEAPDQRGTMFAWGETTTKTFESRICKECTINYNRKNYKFAEGEKLNMVKYFRQNRQGQPEGKTRLEREDDAATCAMGDKWRTPTMAEFQELMKNCIIHNVSESKKYWHFFPYYFVFESKINGNMLVFPARCSYWTSDLADKHETCAKTISYQWGITNGRRWNPLHVRPVCDKQAV